MDAQEDTDLGVSVSLIVASILWFLAVMLATWVLGQLFSLARTALVLLHIPYPEAPSWITAPVRP